MSDRVRVLLVDGDGDEQAEFQRALQETDSEADLRIAPSAERAIRMIRDDGWRPAVVVIDDRLPGISGSVLRAQIVMQLVDPNDVVILRWAPSPQGNQATLCRPMGQSGRAVLQAALRSGRALRRIAAAIAATA